MKKLKVLANALMGIGFIGFLGMVGIFGTEDMPFKTMVISGLISFAVCMGGWLGGQALFNEIEYRENNRR